VHGRWRHWAVGIEPSKLVQTSLVAAEELAIGHHRTSLTCSVNESSVGRYEQLDLVFLLSQEHVARSQIAYEPCRRLVLCTHNP
jgi:hypothetical protein